MVLRWTAPLGAGGVMRPGGPAARRRCRWRFRGRRRGGCQIRRPALGQGGVHELAVRAVGLGAQATPTACASFQASSVKVIQWVGWRSTRTSVSMVWKGMRPNIRMPAVWNFLSAAMSSSFMRRPSSRPP